MIDVEIITAPFGGSWTFATSPKGKTVLESFFKREAAFLAPLNAVGHIVEPYDLAALGEHLDAARVQIKLS